MIGNHLPPRGIESLEPLPRGTPPLFPPRNPQKIRHIGTILDYCWASVAHAGPTLNKHCFHVLLGLSLDYPRPHPLGRI